MTPNVSEVPIALELGTKSELGHKWVDWLHIICCCGGPQRFGAGDKVRNAPQMGRLRT